jgi:hypothetical protein
MTPLLFAGWLAAFGGDAVTTHLALQQGGREFTLPSQNHAVVEGLLAGECALGYWAYRKYHPTHPKLTRVLYFVGVSAHGAATVWNVHQLR